MEASNFLRFIAQELYEILGKVKFVSTQLNAENVQLTVFVAILVKNVFYIDSNTFIFLNNIIRLRVIFFFTHTQDIT